MVNFSLCLILKYERFSQSIFDDVSLAYNSDEVSKKILEMRKTSAERSRVEDDSLVQVLFFVIFYVQEALKRYYGRRINLSGTWKKKAVVFVLTICLYIRFCIIILGSLKMYYVQSICQLHDTHIKYTIV